LRDIETGALAPVSFCATKVLRNPAHILERENMSINIVSKLSLKTIDCDNTRGKKERVHLARIFGIASGIKVAKGQNGEPVYGVTGDFRGINIEKPGDTFQSGILYLPGGINEMLLAAVDTGEVDAKDKPVYREVQFAFDIFAKPSSSPAGYQFEATPVIDAKETDVMAELSSKLPPLPGVEAAPAIEAETKTKAKK